MVSIIVPVYRAEAYLHRCVDSILNQSYGDFELILVDDGSPDKSGMICDDYALKDGRVRVIHQENRGVSAARNVGIDWALSGSCSEWICFIDSDDWVHRDYLRLLVEAVQTYHGEISMCGLYWTDRFREDAELEQVEMVPLNGDQTFAQYFAICNSMVNKLFQKKLMEDVRFPEGKIYAEDASITPRLLCSAERVVVIPEKLYYYYNNPDSAVRAKWSDRKLDAIEAHELRLQFFKEQGCKAAYRRQKEGYVEELTEKIRDLLDCRESEQEHQEILRLLQKKLRAALQSAREDHAVPRSREYLWSYLYAMPTDAVWKAARALQNCYHKLKSR